MTAERERLVSLQILRFVAAMMVALCHAPLAFVGPSSPLAQSLGVGAAGVDIFFVLSGFVITLTGPLADPRPSGALFFWRRWRRVAPVYFLISLPLIMSAWRAGALSWAKTAATFLFWPYAAGASATPYLEPGWTLCFEMAFYSSIALMLVGGNIRRNLVLAAPLVVVAIMARAISPIFVEFAAGVLLARGRPAIMRLPAWVGAALLASGFVGLCVEAAFVLGRVGDEFTVLGGGDLLPRLALFGLPAVVIVCGALICEPRCRGSLAASLAIGGDASYAIYLTHLMARDALASSWRFLELPLASPAFLAASVAAASLAGLAVHRFIERPILRDLKRLSISWPPWRPLAVETP